MEFEQGFIARIRNMDPMFLIPIILCLLIICALIGTLIHSYIRRRTLTTEQREK